MITIKNTDTFKILCTGIVFLLTFLLLFSGCADARTVNGGNDGYIIAIDDLVFCGEERLDVSAFNGATPVTSFRKASDPEHSGFDVPNPSSLTIPGGVSGTYYPAYGSWDTYDSLKPIYIDSFYNALGPLYINIIKNSADSLGKKRSASGVILTGDTSVNYYFNKKDYQSQVSKLTTDIPGWYSVESSMDGSNTKEITGTGSPLNPTQTFTYNNLYAGITKPEKYNAKITFTPNLVSIQSPNSYKISITHIVCSYDTFSIDMEEEKISSGKNIEFTINPGEDADVLPVMKYNLTLYAGGEVLVYFKADSKFNDIVSADGLSLTRIIDTTDKDNPDSNKFTLYAKKFNYDEIGGNDQYLIVNNGYNTMSKTLSIGESSKPKITLPDDAVNGLFSVGDVVKISAEWSDAPEEITGILKISGVNMPETILKSPVNFTDGKNSVYLSTKKFDAGTYVLTLEYENKSISTSFYLNKPTLSVTLNNRNSAVVAGEKLTLNWSARGSPGTSAKASENDILGELHWYLFGTNFASSGMSKFPVFSDNAVFGEDAPEGIGSYMYPKRFSANLSAGSYWVLFDHPGADNNFTISPDTPYFTSFNTLYVNNGETISISSRPTDNVIEMVKQILSDTAISDDIWILTPFTIEYPWIQLTEITEDAKIGDKISLSGASNYPKDTVIKVSISPASFKPEDTVNSAMTMKAEYSAKLTDTADTKSTNTRIFKIDGISTDTWYPGTYIAAITADDYDFEKKVSINVNQDSTITCSDISIVMKTSDTYEAEGELKEELIELIPTPAAPASYTVSPTPTVSPAVSKGLSNTVFIIIIGVAVLIIIVLVSIIVITQKRKRNNYGYYRRRY